jgi:hypothetical protein
MEKKLFLLDKSNWKTIDFPIHPGDAKVVTNVVGRNPGTRWHTWIVHSNYSHHAMVDIAAENSMTTFEIFKMKVMAAYKYNTFRIM